MKDPAQWPGRARGASGPRPGRARRAWAIAPQLVLPQGPPLAAAWVVQLRAGILVTRAAESRAASVRRGQHLPVQSYMKSMQGWKERGKEGGKEVSKESQRE